MAEKKISLDNAKASVIHMLYEFCLYGSIDKELFFKMKNGVKSILDNVYFVENSIEKGERYKEEDDT